MALNEDQVTNAILAVTPSSGGAADIALIKDVIVRRSAIPYTFNDNATAATTSIEQYLWINNTGGNVKVIGAKLVVPVAVTANDTNFKNISLFKRMVATPATQTTILNVTTQTTGQAAGIGSLTAHLATTVPTGAFTGANTVLAPGDVLTAQVPAVGGTGVAVTGATGTIAGILLVYLEPSP